MKALALPGISSLRLREIIFSMLAVTFIYFVPALSHLLNVPIYLIEPMRIMLVLALVHTSRRNAYLLALSLPLFSYLVSAHPGFLKMILISAELSLNVWLFYLIAAKTSNRFVPMVLSIVVSKGAYYLVKWGFLSMAMMSGTLISTPMYIQAITSLVFGIYAYFWFTSKRR